MGTARHFIGLDGDIPQRIICLSWNRTLWIHVYFTTNEIIKVIYGIEGMHELRMQR